MAFPEKPTANERTETGSLRRLDMAAKSEREVTTAFSPDMLPDMSTTIPISVLSNTFSTRDVKTRTLLTARR